MIPTVIQPVGSQEDIASFKGDPSQKDYEPLLERGSSPKLHYKCTVFLETFCFLELGPMRTVHNESSTCDISKPGELKPETRSCKCESIWLFLKFGWTDPLMTIYCVHIYIYMRKFSSLLPLPERPSTGSCTERQRMGIWTCVLQSVGLLRPVSFCVMLVGDSYYTNRFYYLR